MRYICTHPWVLRALRPYISGNALLPVRVICNLYISFAINLFYRLSMNFSTCAINNFCVFTFQHSQSVNYGNT